ncbi:hypothetical protein ACHAQH_006013 [Verticillium albo-atrum]
MGRVHVRKPPASSKSPSHAKTRHAKRSATVVSSRAARLPVEKWSLYRPEICKIYRESDLTRTMQYMEVKHGFYASKRQYVYRLGIWGCKKYGVDNVSEVLGDDVDDIGAETDSDSSHLDQNADNEEEGSLTSTTTPEGGPEFEACVLDGLHHRQKLAADILRIFGDTATAFDLYLQHHEQLVGSKESRWSLPYRLSLANCGGTARGREQVARAHPMIQEQVEKLRGEPSARRFYQLLKVTGALQPPDGDPEAQRSELSDIMNIFEDPFGDGGHALTKLSHSQSLIDLNALVLLCQAEEILTGRQGGHAASLDDRSDIRHKYVMCQLGWSFRGRRCTSAAIEQCFKWCDAKQSQAYDPVSSFLALWPEFAAEALNAQRGQPSWANTCELELGIPPTALLYTVCHGFGKGKSLAADSDDTMPFIKKYLELFVESRSHYGDNSSQLQEIRQLVSQTLSLHLPGQPGQPNTAQGQLEIFMFSEQENGFEGMSTLNDDAMDDGRPIFFGDPSTEEARFELC